MSMQLRLTPKIKHLTGAGVCLFLAAMPCIADSLAAVPLTPTAGVDTHSYVIGWKFAVSAPVTVTALAYADTGGGGLTQSHKVGLFDAASGALLVSATVPAGGAVPFQNGFRLASVTYNLAPGTYVIAGQSPGSADPAMVRATGIQTLPQITYLGEREAPGDDFIMPGVNLQADEIGDFGPSFTIADTAVSPKTITSVVNAGSFQPGAAPGAYMSVFGAALSSTTRGWTLADFGGGTRLPLSLDGVSVTLNNVPAYVEYVSPGQLNFIVPESLPSLNGAVLVVKQAGQPDVIAWIDVQAVAPAFFTWATGTADTGRYAVAQHADGSNAGKANLFPRQTASFTTPVRPGEPIVLYGTGFGETSPPRPQGAIADRAYPLPKMPDATVGGQPLQVDYAGLVASLSNIYQVNVTIPAGLTDGDWPIVVSINGVKSPPVLITVASHP